MQYPRHLILDTKFHRPASVTASHWSFLYTHKLSTTNQIKTELPPFVSQSTWNETTTPTKPLPAFITQTFPHHLFNIHFLRKERLYTKLKYSRCPQYDIVGGGWAALFAGLLGFLISEKFGIELVDSGDFYNALMYAIFGAFAVRPLVKIIDKTFQLKDLLLLPLLIDYLMLMLTLSTKYLLKAFRY